MSATTLPSNRDCPNPYQRAPRALQTNPIARTRLLFPPVSLQGAIVSFISCDTRNLCLTAAQRLSHFPSSPLVCLTWFKDTEVGLVDICEAGHSWRPFSSSIMLSGSQSNSTVCWARTTGRVGMMTFTADVARALLKIDVGAVQDRFIPAREILSSDLWPFLNALLGAVDDAMTISVLEDYLAPLWQVIQSRPAASPSLSQVGRHWVARLARQAHEWRQTQSLRQVERRIKVQSGRSIREWRSLVKTEGLFFASRDRIESGLSINWAELALDEGFSDQSHLSRATKRVTGFSPSEFAKRYVEDESFWLYRLWV
jgi:AraC-like DNA-binding protein